MNNKVCIVTGGSRGIGKAIVEKLAISGYDVIFTYNKSEESAKIISENFSNVYPFHADVSSEDDVETLIDFTYNKYNKIDLLINNAGIDLFQTIDNTTFGDFDNIMKTNLYSVYYSCKFVAPIMISQKFGSIINISSVWGNVGASCESAYAASKAGINALTKSLAKELGPSNIRVNAIAPGLINTDMNSNLSIDDISNVVEEIPLGHIGEPNDIADCVLMIENCSYINGQIITVDGGWIS